MAERQGFFKSMAQNVQSFFITKAVGTDLKGAQPKALAVGSQANGMLTQTLGIPKENTGTSFKILRKIALMDPVVSNCITIIKKEVSQCPYKFVKRAGVAKIDQEELKKAQAFFNFINPDGENLRMLFDRIIEDILACDAGAVEVVYNHKDEVVGLNSVDGTTIRLRINEFGDLDDVAYIQVIDGIEKATFSKNELIYLMMNPQNDVNRYPYGMSPIEKILLTIQANLNAETHNLGIFSSDNVPAGILNLGNIHQYDAEEIIAQWQAQIIGSPNQMKFMWGPDKMDFLDFKKSNRDMQYVEYLDRLTRLILAAYGLSAIDLNIIQDVNRSTAGAQTKMSNARGVQSMKQLIEEMINGRLMPLLGFETIVWKFEDYIDLTDRKNQADIDAIYLEMGVISPNEIRERDGLPPLAKPLTDMTPTPEQKTQKSAYPVLY